jgi:predicted N-acetyltransferase YhbS
VDATITVTMPSDGRAASPARQTTACFEPIAPPLSSLTAMSRLSSMRPEAPADAAFIDPILDAAFGPGRFAKSSERVREFAGHNLALSQIAVEAGAVIGCCRIYDIQIGAKPALFVGPLAVHPSAQAAGVGQALVASSLAGIERAHGQTLPVLVVGQPAFFARFGFVQTPQGQIIMPSPTDPRRLQWLHADPSARGVVSAPRDAS